MVVDYSKGNGKSYALVLSRIPNVRASKETVGFSCVVCQLFIALEDLPHDRMGPHVPISCPRCGSME